MGLLVAGLLLAAALEIEEVFTLRGYMRLPDTGPACPTWLFLPPGPGSPEPVEVRTASTPQRLALFTAEMPAAEATSPSRSAFSRLSSETKWPYI